VRRNPIEPELRSFVDEVTFVFFYEHCDGVDSSESVQGFLLPYVSHLGTIQIVP